MKKILIFGYSMEIGGAEKLLIDLLNKLNKKFDIHLVLLEKKGSYIELIPDNVEVTEIKSSIFYYVFF